MIVLIPGAVKRFSKHKPTTNSDRPIDSETDPWAKGPRELHVAIVVPRVCRWVLGMERNYVFEDRIQRVLYLISHPCPLWRTRARLFLLTVS